MVRGEVAAVVVVVALGTIVGVAAANEPPQSEAGLDQNVSQGTTVYLDAGGSVDPDGSISSYNWTITAPDDARLSPACGSCAQTRFVADQAGTYEVHLAVTDDDGATRTDTMTVVVRAGNPPSVQLSGPQAATTGEGYTYQASVSAGDSSLASLQWERNGTTVETVQLTGESATRTREMGFDASGAYTVDVSVRDTTGRTASDSLTVDVSNPASTTDSGNAGSSSSGTDGTGFYEEIERFDGTGGDFSYNFNFLDGDNRASNTVGDGHGGDKSGYGVYESTLESLSRNNPDVTLSDPGEGETTYTVSGDIAENFADHDETYQSGVRVGTNDIITESGFLGESSQSGSGDSSGGTLDDIRSGGSEGTSSDGGTSGGSQTDTTLGSSGGSSSSDTSGSSGSSDNSGALGDIIDDTVVSPGGSTDNTGETNIGGSSDSGSSSSSGSSSDTVGAVGSFDPDTGGSSSSRSDSGSSSSSSDSGSSSSTVGAVGSFNPDTGRSSSSGSDSGSSSSSSDSDSSSDTDYDPSDFSGLRF